MTGRVLYLIRHGQSDFDWAGDRWASARGDQWDPPLSEKGREQAALLAKRLLVMDLEPFARVFVAAPARGRDRGGVRARGPVPR